MASEESQQLDARSVMTNILCEFLEVAVHLILYVREVYPAGIFKKRKKYNVPVQMSCHPELNQYIQDVLHSIKPCLEKGEVERICVAVIDKEFRPLERFVFEIGSHDENHSLRTDDRYLLNTESALRGFLLKISVCDAVLKANPPDCRFTILVYTKQSAVLNMQRDDKAQTFPWLHVDGEEETADNPSIIPLKSTSSGLLKMQLFVEESGGKSTV